MNKNRLKAERFRLFVTDSKNVTSTAYKETICSLQSNQQWRDYFILDLNRINSCRAIATIISIGNLTGCLLRGIKLRCLRLNLCPASVRYRQLNRFITISTLIDMLRESAAPVSRYIHKHSHAITRCVLSKGEDSDAGQKACATKI